MQLFTAMFEWMCFKCTPWSLLSHSGLGYATSYAHHVANPANFVQKRASDHILFTLRWRIQDSSWQEVVIHINIIILSRFLFFHVPGQRSTIFWSYAQTQGTEPTSLHSTKEARVAVRICFCEITFDNKSSCQTHGAILRRNKLPATHTSVDTAL